MATALRRVSKSAIDWAAFAQRVPEWQMPAFRALKARSDMFVQRVHKYPASSPAIDWDAYKAKISTPGVVDALQKALEGAKIPIMEAKEQHEAVDKEAQQFEVESEEFEQEMRKQVELCERGLAMLDKLPSFNNLTYQMDMEYFPETFCFMTEPTVWPHRLSDQPGGNPYAPEETWDRKAGWRQKDGKMRPLMSLTHRDFEPLNHDEAYGEWCLEKAQEQVTKMKAQNASAEKLEDAEKLVEEARAMVQEQRAARQKAYDELDAWRAAGSQL